MVYCSVLNRFVVRPAGIGPVFEKPIIRFDAQRARACVIDGQRQTCVAFGSQRARIQRAYVPFA